MSTQLFPSVRKACMDLGQSRLSISTESKSATAESTYVPPTNDLSFDKMILVTISPEHSQSCFEGTIRLNFSLELTLRLE